MLAPHVLLGPKQSLALTHVPSESARQWSGHLDIVYIDERPAPTFRVNCSGWFVFHASLRATSSMSSQGARSFL